MNLISQQFTTSQIYNSAVRDGVHLLKNPKFLALAVLIFLFKNHLHWYLARLNDGDAILCFIPLAFAITFLFTQKKSSISSAPKLALIPLTIYLLTLPILPPLLQTTLALATLAFLFGFWKKPGLVILFTLALPIQASLDFFLAYPLRLLTANGTSSLLNLFGNNITLQGIQLLHAKQVVTVAPACSGLNTLWSAGLFTAILACLYRLNWKKTTLLGVAALTLVIIANTLRASLLFFPEAGLINAPTWLHPLVGLILYALCLFALRFLAQKLSISKNSSHSSHSSHSFKTPYQIILTLALLGLAAQAIQNSKTPPSFTEKATLTHFDHQPLTPIPLSESEAQFYRHFPGEISIYQMDDSRVIIRHLTRASRRLHPVAHCLRAEGYHLEPAIIITRENQNWSRFLATRDGETIEVRERIHSLQNKSQWTEVSPWFWFALFHPADGPWQALAIITPQNFPTE